MAIIDLTLLTLLLPVVLARPGGDHHAHAHLHERRHVGTGLPGPLSGSVPFPVGNNTGAPTGTGTGGGGPIYVTSTLHVVPQPITTDIYGSHGGAGSGIGGNSPETGLPGGPGGSGGSGGSECGPATVTVTNANTVTVTVTPSAPGGGSGPGEGSGESSSASGTGSEVAPAPAPVTTTTSSAVAVTPPVVVPAPSSTSSQPVEIYSPLAQEKNKKPHNAPHQPPAGQPASTTPAQGASTPAQSIYTPPAVNTPPVAYTSPAVNTPPAVYTPPETQPSSVGGGESPSAPESSSSAAAPKPSSSPSKVGPKGLIYNNAQQANSMDVAWACNWGQTPGVANPTFEYVPQLWGPKLNFGQTIASNAAGSEFVLFYNEPDIPTSEGGSGVDVGTAVQDWHTYMKPLQAQGKLVSTPCVANSNGAYMDTFLSSFPSGTMDVLCFHWYGPEIDGLKQTVEEFKGYASKYGIKQIWISEMAVLPLPADLSEFTSYLDGAVDRYAYNLNNLGSASY